MITIHTGHADLTNFCKQAASFLKPWIVNGKPQKKIKSKDASPAYTTVFTKSRMMVAIDYVVGDRDPGVNGRYQAVIPMAVDKIAESRSPTAPVPWGVVVMNFHERRSKKFTEAYTIKAGDARIVVERP